MWTKLNNRRLSPQMAIAWNLGFGEPTQKHIGVSILHTLQYFDSNSTDYYADAQENNTYMKRLETLLEDEHFLETAYEEAKSFLETTSKWAQTHFTSTIPKKSNSELALLYRKLAEELEPQFYVRMWMVYRISHPLALLVERKILQQTNNPIQTAEFLKVFSTPLKTNNVMDERMDALKIAIQKEKVSKKEFGKLIQKHTQKYASTPMYGFDHTPFDENYFRNEIHEIEFPQKELDETLADLKNRKREFDSHLIQLNPGEKLRKLIRFFSDMVYLRDYRDLLRVRLNHAGYFFYLELAKRMHITLEQTNLLTNNEILEFLEKNKTVSLSEIHSREKAWLLIQSGTKIQMYSGERARKNPQKEIGLTGENEVKELKGTPASLGKAKGNVCMVHTNKDLSKIKKGDIMITYMTRQDYIPFVRKCKALITEEGGTTSHAAIICRELKIPCIVGTENVTKVFKSGDKIEMDAQKGWIRKIS